MDEEAGSVLGGERIVGRPLVEDQQGEVTKQAGHEDDLWDEAQEDVQRLLEVPAVTNTQWEYLWYLMTLGCIANPNKPAQEFSNHSKCFITQKILLTFSLSFDSSTYRWLKRLRDTPNSMWMTPRTTDIFILKELRKVSLLEATFQICRDDRTGEQHSETTLI